LSENLDGLVDVLSCMERDGYHDGSITTWMVKLRWWRFDFGDSGIPDESE
jgi:hypothetical protein